MKKILTALMIIVVFGSLAAGLSACGSSGDEKTAEPAGTTDSLARDAEAVIESLQDISVDLSGDTFTDLAVPAADMDTPEIDFGFFNIDIDYDPTQALPELVVPGADSIMGGISTDLMPDIPEGFVPDDSICAQFADVPDCSFVPEKYRELCEECKERNQ